MNQKRIGLLPEDEGSRVIKIDLEPRKDEKAREVLFITPCGEVNMHPCNQDISELYIPVKNGQVDASSLVFHVAGSNSPTGQTEHAVSQEPTPQVILVIRKGAEQDAWDKLKNDPEQFFGNLSISTELIDSGNQLVITSNNGKNKEETVTIDFNERGAKYQSCFTKGPNRGAILVEESEKLMSLLCNRATEPKGVER